MKNHLTMFFFGFYSCLHFLQGSFFPFLFLPLPPPQLFPQVLLLLFLSLFLHLHLVLGGRTFLPLLVHGGWPRHCILRCLVMSEELSERNIIVIIVINKEISEFQVKLEM